MHALHKHFVAFSEQVNLPLMNPPGLTSNWTLSIIRYWFSSQKQTHSAMATFWQFMSHTHQHALRMPFSNLLTKCQIIKDMGHCSSVDGSHHSTGTSLLQHFTPCCNQQVIMRNISPVTAFCKSCHAMSSLAWIGVVHDGKMFELVGRLVEWDVGWCSASYRHLAITGLVPIVTKLLADRCRWSTSAGRMTNCSGHIQRSSCLSLLYVFFLASFKLIHFLLPDLPPVVLLIFPRSCSFTNVLGYCAHAYVPVKFK